MRALLVLVAMSATAAQLAPVPNFARANSASTLRIVAPCQPRMPWTVAGPRGALFGRQNGIFEAWQWPVKLLSHFAIRAELANYPVPIDVNALAAQIEVTPAETTITYSHAAFTIRQHMFAARGGNAPVAGAVVFFEIAAARPLEVTFSFTPEMLRMWPAPNFGRPNGEWIAQGESGFYVLHTDNSDFSGLVAMPHTRPGIMPPYQEHPQTYPLELKLSYDPERDRGLVYPLLMAMRSQDAANEQAASMNGAVADLYRATQNYYDHFFDTRLTVETPDKRVNDALRWAEIAIDQMQIQYHDEIGLAAGYYESADSARPGYAWFFGRDTLWTSYAINSYGDFALTRRALDFLIRRQRADGKIMHEYSQSADAVDWQALPYFYASADSTPLLVMAVWDYVRMSGDAEYLQRNWEAVKKAYAFTRAHESEDGIYNNTQGTGWVESWPPGMPHQEIYLAALDGQSAEAMGNLATMAADANLAQAARAKAAELRGKIEAEYYNSRMQFYAFSRNANGSLDDTASIYPSVAWWDGTLQFEHAGPMLTRWASDEFSTDWGTRDISPKTPFYDPISYHQGSIWPLFTGWVSLAEYRAGRPLSAYAHMMQNLQLTWAQDLGAVTELLSGQFFQPPGRSSSHQMWSSAMVIAPLVRGLFGVTVDVLNKEIRLDPHWPAEWEHAWLHNVPFAERRVDLEYQREGGELVVTERGAGDAPICIAGTPPVSCKTGLRLPLPPIEISIPAELPGPGVETRQLKVLDEQFEANRATFRFAAPGGAKYDLSIRLNRAHARAEGAAMNGGKLHLEFPTGAGYQETRVTFVW